MYVSLISDEIHAKHFTNEEAKEWHQKISEMLAPLIILCCKAELDCEFWIMKDINSTFYINEVV